jgi:glycosyltransferase involved in cell wall biosynthesis
MGKVSVVIPTYNRLKYLLHAIKSCQEQTYPNIEIIVVNDRSTLKEYYTYDFNKLGKNIHVLHLPKNSQEMFGRVAGGGNARNIGMMMASGAYIAFLDDDDYFLPTKIEKQIAAMKQHNVKISCTEALTGKGAYNQNWRLNPPHLRYKNHHYKGVYWDALTSIFEKCNSIDTLNRMYENETNVWGELELNIHNCTCGGSSIIMDKGLIEQAGIFPIMSFAEDWTYWKKIIKYSKCVFIREPLTYIDSNHGDGQNY